jgi:hypothetical protein
MIVFERWTFLWAPFLCQLIAFFVPCTAVVVGQNEHAEKYSTEQDVLYRDGDELTDAMRDRCKLDVYFQQGGKSVPTIVWFHVRRDAPPLLLISGDRNQELLGRYEESAYFWRMMKIVGHPDIELIELTGRDHANMIEPAYEHLLQFVRERSARIKMKPER